MNKMKLFSILLFILNSYSLIAQDFCATSSNIPDILQTIPSAQLRSGIEITNKNYTFRVFFHIIRKSNGTGGQSQSDVNTAFNILNADYAPYGISFELLGMDEILNDTYYDVNINFSCNANNDGDCDGDGKFDNFHPNSHANAIDIYFFGYDKFNQGLAAYIPSTALVIGGNKYNTNLATSHVLTHEIGHCLGLYHTFHGLCEGGIAELVNENDCLNRGDFVCDTPADPTYFNINQNDCTWNGSTCTGSTKDANGDSYHPNTSLYMAYIPPNCMQQHTPGQVERMKAVIANSSILQNVLAPVITGPDAVCPGTTATFTADNFSGPVSWTCSSNLTMTYNGNTATITSPSDLPPLQLNSINNVTDNNSQNAQSPLLTIDCNKPVSSWIRATDVGTSYSVVKTITTNKVCVSSIVLMDSEILPDGYVKLTFVAQTKAAAPMTWTVTPGNELRNLIRNDLICSFEISQKSTLLYTITASSNNVCGGSQASTTYGGPPCVDCPLHPIELTISPNPSSSEISVEITTDDADSQPVVAVEPSYTVSITDVSGSPAYKGKKKGKKFHLSVSSLKNGVYNVTVSDGEKTGHGKLIVKH